MVFPKKVFLNSFKFVDSIPLVIRKRVFPGLLLFFGMGFIFTAFLSFPRLGGEPTGTGELISSKPTPRWRLNSNGYSQRYIELTGANRVERMKQLLAYYGHHNYDAWQTIARVYRIYPEVMICVSYADSSLGKHLKSEKNWGNVGNNDRGDTMSFTTDEQGINAIGKVLNNQYLGKKNLIGELSPGGKLGKSPYYATSPENHFNNLSNCLGMIHDKGVNNDRKFRR